MPHPSELESESLAAIAPAAESSLRRLCVAIRKLPSHRSERRSILTELLPSFPSVIRDCCVELQDLMAERQLWEERSRQLVELARLHCGDEVEELHQTLTGVSSSIQEVIHALNALRNSQPAADGEPPDVEAALRTFGEATLQLMQAGPDQTSVISSTVPALLRSFSRSRPDTIARLRKELLNSQATSEQLLCLAAIHFGPSATQLQQSVRDAQHCVTEILDSLDELSDSRSERPNDPRRSQRHTSIREGRRQAITFYQMANRSFARQDLKLADVLYSEALRYDDELRSAWLQRGRVRLLRGRTQEAVVDFSHAARLEPSDPQVWRWRGDALVLSGELQEALADYDRSLRLQPDCLKTRYNRAVVLRQSGRLDRAWNEFDELSRLQPDHAPTWLNRGLICHLRQQRDQAIAEFRTALKCQPGLPEAIQGLKELGAEPSGPLIKQNHSAAAVSPVTISKPAVTSPVTTTLKSVAVPLALTSPKHKLTADSTSHQKSLATEGALIQRLPVDNRPNYTSLADDEEEIAITMLAAIHDGATSSAQQTNPSAPVDSGTTAAAGEIQTLDQVSLNAMTVQIPSTDEQPAGGRTDRSSRTSSHPGGTLEIRCPACRTRTTVKWDLLTPGKVVSCPHCDGHFTTQPSGRMVSVTRNRRGEWRPVRESAAFHWNDYRTLTGMAAILLVAVSLMFFAFRNQDSYVEDPGNHPVELEPRARAFAIAWLKGDFKTMRQLTDPVQTRELFMWCMEHPIPPLKSPMTLERDVNLDVDVVTSEQNSAHIQVKIDGLKVTRGRPVSELALIWKQEGETWLFQPSSPSPL